MPEVDRPRRLGLTPAAYEHLVSGLLQRRDPPFWYPPVGVLKMLDQALQSSFTVVLVRGLAVVLILGAAVHIANILGFGERPWFQMARLWRTMDVVLLVFNIVVGIALWFKTPWGIVAFMVGIVALQIIPYTVFRSRFIETPHHAATLKGMVIFWIVTLALLFATVLWFGAAS